MLVYPIENTFVVWIHKHFLVHPVKNNMSVYIYIYIPWPSLKTWITTSGQKCTTCNFYFCREWFCCALRKRLVRPISLDEMTVQFNSLQCNIKVLSGWCAQKGSRKGNVSPNNSSPIQCVRALWETFWLCAMPTAWNPAHSERSLLVVCWAPKWVDNNQIVGPPQHMDRGHRKQEGPQGRSLMLPSTTSGSFFHLPPLRGKRRVKLREACVVQRKRVFRDKPEKRNGLVARLWAKNWRKCSESPEVTQKVFVWEEFTALQRGMSLRQNSALLILMSLTWFSEQSDHV